MKNDFKQGDLVFVPSSVRLVQFNHEENHSPSFVHKHTMTSKPSRALLMDSIDDYCKIYYNGEYWFAKEQDIYKGES